MPQDLFDNSFYLRTLSNPKRIIWYYRKDTGRGTLGNVVKKIMAKTGFEGYYTNHPLRRSCATKVYDNYIPEQVIQEITRQRSVEGVRAYKYMSSTVKREMSAVLHSVETPSENGCSDKEVSVCEATFTLDQIFPDS